MKNCCNTTSAFSNGISNGIYNTMTVKSVREAAACAQANCASSATNATNAANSATAAAASAAAAATSETNTENLWEQFNALYLGSFAVAPTTDNEGNPLQEGALYWNSVSNTMFAWDGSAWAAATNFNEFTNFTATGTTTARNLVTRMADVVNVLDFGADPTGATPSTTAIVNALIASNNIVFTKGLYKIDTNITIGSGKSVTFEPGALITSDSVFVLSFNNNSELFAGRHKIFNNFASASNVSIVYPEWWGITNGDTGTTISPTANAAFLSALSAVRGNQGIISLDRTTYIWDGTAPITITNGVSIIGQGIGKTGFKIVTEDNNLFIIQNCKFVKIEGFTTTSYVTPTSGTILKVICSNALTPAGNITIKDLYISNCWRFLDITGTDHGTRVNTTEIFNVTVYGALSRALYCRWIENIYVNGLFVNATDLTGGTEGIILLREGCSGGDFVDCNFSNGQGYSLNCLSSYGNVREYNVMWFRFTNCNFDDSSCGAYITDSHDMEFINCRFWSCGRTSRGRLEGPGAHIDNSTCTKFIGCSFNNNGGNGLQVQSNTSFLTVTNCDFIGNNINNYVLNYTSLWGGIVSVAGFFCTNVNNININNSKSGNGIGGWNGVQKYGYYFGANLAYSSIVNNSSFAVVTEGIREPSTSTVNVFDGNIDNDVPLVMYSKTTGQVNFVSRPSDPSDPVGGDVYYNSTTNKLRVYNGTIWIDLH